MYLIILNSSYFVLIILIFISIKHVIIPWCVQCMKDLLVDADELLIALQNGLSQHEVNFATFIEQQHEVHYLITMPTFYLFIQFVLLIHSSDLRKKLHYTGAL